MLTRRGSAALTTLLSKRADVSRQGLASAWSPSFGGQSASSSQALVWSALQLLPLRVRPSCGLHCIRCIRARPSCGLHRIAIQQCTVACLRMYRLHGGAEWRLVQEMAVCAAAAAGRLLLPPPPPQAPPSWASAQTLAVFFAHSGRYAPLPVRALACFAIAASRHCPAIPSTENTANKHNKRQNNKQEAEQQATKRLEQSTKHHHQTANTQRQKACPTIGHAEVSME